MKLKSVFSILFLFLFLFSQSGNVLAAVEPSNGTQKQEKKVERKVTERDESAYELMSYADDSWYDVAGKAGSATATAVKNFFWMINIVISQIIFMVVYQLFSLDIVEMTKDSIQAIASGTAGALIYKFGLFALAIASIGIVIRAYVQQNWRAFFKLVTMLIICMALLFSIQSKKFNYIDFAHGLSTTLENTIMAINPTLTKSDDFDFATFDKTTAVNISTSIENKVFDALLYKPYLLLQYGTTNEKEILKEDDNRIKDYLDADPRTEEGIKKRETIAETEYKKLDNKNIFAGNGWKQAGYILIMILSSTIQGVVFFFISLLRIMLQFGFIIMMLLAPFMIFLSLFPSFEHLVGRYTKGTFMVILFKAMTMFIVLVATSFISLGYDMTDASNDLYYRIFIQIIFSVAVIFMYAKRQFILSMFEGGSLSLDEMGGGSLTRRGMLPSRSKNMMKNPSLRPKRNLMPVTRNAGKQRNVLSQARNKLTGAMGVAGSKMRNAQDHVKEIQKGNVPGMKNEFNTAGKEIAASKEGGSSKGNSSQQQHENVNVLSKHTNVHPISSARNPKPSSANAVTQPSKTSKKSSQRKASSQTSTKKTNVNPSSKTSQQKKMKANTSSKRNPYQQNQKRQQKLNKVQSQTQMKVSPQRTVEPKIQHVKQKEIKQEKTERLNRQEGRMNQTTRLDRADNK